MVGTLVVVNTHFEPTANNRLQYESSSNVSIYQGNTQVLSVNTTAFQSNGVLRAPGTYDIGIGTYVFSSNATVPNSSFIALSNTLITFGTYPLLDTAAGITEGGTMYKQTAANTGMVAVGYGNGIFVMVGSGGIQTSTDGGISWTNRTSANGGTTAVSYGNGVYVICGQSGAVQSSPDAIAWTNQLRANSSSQTATAYGNGVYVTCGVSGSVCSSTDGTTWTNNTRANANNLNGVAYGNGIFLAVGGSAFGSAATSPNGTAWTARAPGGNILLAVAYGNGVFVAVGTNALKTTVDGVTWQSPTNPASAFQLTSITYGNGVFIATGDAQMYSNDNGATWTLQHPYETWQQVGGITYGNGFYISVATGVAPYVSFSNRYMLAPYINTYSFSSYTYCYVRKS
jgi:hypothetical protein